MVSSLPLITALARAGALDRASAVFEEAGMDALHDDPAVLAVKGRLLKDRALRAVGAQREQFLKAAAEVYAAADTISPQPYLLINVATLAGLQGHWAEAARTAGTVLERLSASDGIAETPYYIEATRAEAHLLRGEVEVAESALATAIGLSPDSWPDHASTLRQLRLIEEARGGDFHWLDPYRPPASLHFAGHLGIDPSKSAALRAEIDTILGDERIGFGYGALAAGADIIVAEALLARGAELHIVLPTAMETFAAQSVQPYDPAWLPRFEICLAAAASVQVATRVSGEFEPKASALAGEMAMGAALLNARMLESRALQLLIVDDGDGPFGEGINTARDGEIWMDGGHEQRVIAVPRSAAVPPSKGKTEGRADYRLMALLHLGFAGLDQAGEGDFADALDHAIGPFRARAEGLPVRPHSVQATGNAWILSFESPAEAARYALALHTLDPPPRWPLAVAGHYGLLHETASGLLGPSVAIVQALAALPGSVTVSEPFAAALQLQSDAGIDAELTGEAEGYRLFALSRRRDQ